MIALAIVITAAGLFMGFLLKRPCARPNVGAGDPYRRDCYSDIVFLYPRHDFEAKDSKTIPFSSGGLAYRDNNLEYPALTGLLITTANVFVAKNDAAGFLRTNAIILALVTLIAAGCLASIASQKWRMVLLSFSPALVSYAFHNWDLLPMSFLAIGIWAYTRERDWFAGAMFGLGAAAKVFPGLAIPAFVLARKKQGKPIGRMVAGSVVWFAIPNLIVLAYAGRSGWWFPWKFQSQRFPNFETLAYFLYQHLVKWVPRWSILYTAPGQPSTYAKYFQVGSLLVFAVASIFLLYREYNRTSPFRPIATSMGIIILFLITAKVYSPQYSVWLLPFFVLLDLPLWAFVVFAVTDMLVLSLIWSYFIHVLDHSVSAWVLHWLEIGVYVRYLGLGAVLWASRRVNEHPQDEQEIVEELVPVTA